MPAKVQTIGKKTWTQAACIICGGDAKRYGRPTGTRYGERYICEKCTDEGYTFNRAGDIVKASSKLKPAIEWPLYEALVFKVLEYADEEIVTRERDKTYSWVRSLPEGEALIEAWYNRKS